MGNYKDIETEFVERTLALVSQYESLLHRYKFEEQYNYTLLINCLLGLVVLPKERTLSYIPKNTLLDKSFLAEMGITATEFHPDIKELKELVIALRHSVAHFHIRVESLDEQFHIDQIIFNDPQKGPDYVVARFQARDLLPFIRYYSHWLLSNLNEYRKQRFH